MITSRNKASTVKLLVTCFGSFPGMPSNPSARVVAAFAKAHRGRLARLGIDLVTTELPVVYDKVEEAMRAQLTTTSPDAVIHVGVAGRRAKLTIETRALNRIGTLRTDAARKLSAARCVVPRGAAKLSARWPVARLVAAMTASGAATTSSIDAGDYVCNQTLYHTLHRTDVPAGFLHIPKPRARGRRKRSIPGLRPRLEDMVRALAQAAVVTAVSARGRG